MSKLRVGFNTLPLEDTNKYRGIGTHTKQLLSHLKQRDDVEIREFTDISKLERVDLIHYPFFDFFRNTLPLKKKFSTVVTIHDVIPLKFPKYYLVGIKGRWALYKQKRALKNVDSVITISKSAKSDINKILGIDETKIFDIALAVDDRFKQIKDDKRLTAVQSKFALPENFAVYVGDVNWNKNIVRLTEACINSNTHVVFVGKSFINRDNLERVELKEFKEFLDQFSTNPLVHILGYVEDDELVSIMNLATVCLLPSLYEGFGLTILEAQACGTPVITSNTSSMPEVAGDSALLVDPTKVEEIEKALLRITGDKNLRRKLVDSGIKNVSRFSWEETARKTVEVYRNVKNK